MRDVIISEVGPRDGLQSISRSMPTDVKIAWIAALAGAGLPEIEVGSFVSPRLLPQMADVADVVAASLTLPDVEILALVPNLKGAERAFAAGVHKVTMPISASRLHSQSNVNMSPEEAVAEFAAVVRLRESLPGNAAGGRRRPGVEAGISTAFGCTMEGVVSEDWVIALAGQIAGAGADSITFSDTTGMGNPAQVRRLFTRARREFGDLVSAAHFHNTRGQGLANVVAALDAGITTFDSSQAGLGGCPYAPGATGNIVTEDLVFLLESMGLRTGVDLNRLIAARALILEGLPGEILYGHVPDAGLPKGFVLSSQAPARSLP